MKELVKRFSCSVLLVLAGTLMLFSSHPLADTTLDHSGKIRLQTERIGQDAVEREKLESQDHKETELEKTAPDLFKDQTRAAIKTKQVENEKKAEELQQGLFVTPSEPKKTLKDTEKILFSSDYKVQYTAVPSEGSNENDGLISAKTWTAILGFIIVGCGGLFTMMKKLLE